MRTRSPSQSKQTTYHFVDGEDGGGGANEVVIPLFRFEIVKIDFVRLLRTLERTSKQTQSIED